MPVDFAAFKSRDDDIMFVIEGDDVIRSALHFILTHQNETHSFATLDLAYARAGDMTPDLILLGIDLLGQEGRTVLSQICRRFPSAEIMIVANTVDDPLALKALRWGAHDVLAKPISFDSIHRSVERVRRRRKQAATLLGLLPPSAAW